MLIKVLSKMQNRKTVLKAMRKGLARGLSWQKPLATMPDDFCLILRTYMVQDANNSHRRPLTPHFTQHTYPHRCSEAHANS